MNCDKCGKTINQNTDIVYSDTTGVYCSEVCKMANNEITSDMAGCWLDGARGVYIFPAIIREAESFGMELSEEDTLLVSMGEEFMGMSSLTSEESEGLFFLAERAEVYLDDLAPEGYWIGFNDGDFGMYPIEEENQEDG